MIAKSELAQRLEEIGRLQSLHTEAVIRARRRKSGARPVGTRPWLNADPQAVLNVALGRGPAVKAEAKVERVA